MSRIHEKKGLELLIVALSQVNHEFHLIIAGSGELSYENKLKQMIDFYKLAKKVTWTGFITGEMKDSLLQGSDLLALTSYSENFGIVVLEALAAGLPVIISEEVALSSIVKDNDLGFITSLDADSIRFSLEKALNDRQGLKEKGDRARKFVLQNYTWDKVVQNLIAIYEKLTRQM